LVLWFVEKSQNEVRTIVFIDENGLSQRPHRCRTWTPCGMTPVLQYHFYWKTLTAMAGGDLVELLLPALSRRHPQPPDHRVSATCATHFRPTADRLEWIARPSQPLV
jgi:hypothetical protein